MKANQEIRRYAKVRGVKHWEIAAYLGISEQTILRWLRTPLPTEKETAIREAVDAIERRKSDAQCVDYS